MIEPRSVICWVVSCGICHEVFGSDDVAHFHWDSKEEAIAAVKGDGWEVNGDVATCPTCATRKTILEEKTVG